MAYNGREMSEPLAIYLAKAKESLPGVLSDDTQGRYRHKNVTHVRDP